MKRANILKLVASIAAIACVANAAHAREPICRGGPLVGLATEVHADGSFKMHEGDLNEWTPNYTTGFVDFSIGNDHWSKQMDDFLIDDWSQGVCTYRIVWNGDKIFHSDLGDFMSTNSRSVAVMPRSLTNILQIWPAGINPFFDAFNEGFSGDGLLTGLQDPSTSISSPAPGKLYVSQVISGPTPIFAGPVWAGNWDLTNYPADDVSVRIQSVTLPRIYVKRPSGVLSKCTVVLFLAQYDPTYQYHFRLLGSGSQIAIAGGSSYITVGPITIDWDQSMASLSSASNDPHYFSSKEFLQTMGFGVMLQYQSDEGSGTRELDMGFNIDPAHPTVDPIDSWGTEGVTINYTLHRSRGMML